MVVQAAESAGVLGEKHETNLFVDGGKGVRSSFRVMHISGPFQKEIQHPLQPAEFSTLMHFQHPPAQE